MMSAVSGLVEPNHLKPDTDVQKEDIWNYGT